MALLEQAEDFVQNLFKDKLSEAFLYHNFGHTLSVVNSVKLMAKDLKLTAEENEQLFLAAWFHDTGYTQGCEKHEASSSKIVQSFLQEKSYPEAGITKVISLINATQMHYQPVNELEKIIKDADYSHLAKKDFFAVSELRISSNFIFFSLPSALSGTNSRLIHAHSAFFPSGCTSLFCPINVVQSSFP